MPIAKSFCLLLFSTLIFIGCSDDDNALNSPKNINRLSLGDSAHDLLSAKKYKSLVVEVVSVKGFEPTTEAIDYFRDFLNARLFKPDGITINLRSVTSSKLAPFTTKEILEIENSTRTKFNTDNEITVFIYFADGRNIEDTTSKITLGSSYLNTSMVIYEETVRNLSFNPDSPSISTIESATLTHEFSHLLGLVNIGSKAQSNHENMEAKGHCNSTGCLMESSIEFGNKVLEISGNKIPFLDSQCITDLQANGGK